MKRWEIAPKAPDHYIDDLRHQGVHPVVAQVLYNRGFADSASALGFLGHYLPDDNPFRLKGMVEAIYRIRTAIRNRERIAVYGDFDCDGVTATVVMTEALRCVGADVMPYIPDRVDEGYGLNSPALKFLADEGISLVITVDCGIRSVQEVADANSYGLDMIITDHHSIGPTLPPALAIINPKQANDTYPEKGLAGVGIAYKVVQGLFMEAQRRGIRGIHEWRPEDWLELVAVGTVADIVPLKGENRSLVRRGLKRLNNTQRPGLQALYSIAGIQKGNVTSATIGFVIGPRINAAGRLRSAMLAFNLLTAPNVERGAQLAQELNALNTERQHKTKEMQQWAEENMPADADSQALLFAAREEFEQGAVGLVASRLTERYYRPSVVVQIGENESHGSCRSIPEFHITRALEMCADLLERYGGHSAAAGFTVANENIAPLRERLIEIAEDSLYVSNLKPTLIVDAELPLEEASTHLLKALSQLEPTGEANRPPLFRTSKARIADMRRVGRDGAHLKLRLENGSHTQTDAIAFRQGQHAEDLPERVDIVYHLELNEYKGNKRLQLNIQDIKPTD